MDIVVGKKKDLDPAQRVALWRYRYRVFVGALGWELGCEPDAELDQFDHDEALYLLAYAASGEVVGCARLLPTVQPYLLGEVFPQLLNGECLPFAADTWELSRFAALDLDQPVQGPQQFSSAIASELLQAVLRVAASRGARHLISVSPLGVERLLRRAGFDARRAGPPLQVGRHWLFACWIEVPARTYTIGEVTQAPGCRSIGYAA